METAVLLSPFFVQGVLMSVDEFHYHWKRGLPRWERIGHPLDTLTVLSCVALARFVPYSDTAKWAFLALAVFSCLFITKDEFVHSQHCEKLEQWLHSLLFVVHPVVFLSTWQLWKDGRQMELSVLFWILLGWVVYQIVFWNFLRTRQ